MSAIKDRLEYLRGELRAERISYCGIAELQDLAPHIDPADTELLEAAGVPELRDDKTINDLLTMLRIVTADYRSLRAAYFATPQGGDGTCPAVLEAEALIERITNPLT